MSTIPNTEMQLAYCVSELGEVLVIVTSASSYSTFKAYNHANVVTAQSLAQIKTHAASVNPKITSVTG